MPLLQILSNGLVKILLNVVSSKMTDPEITHESKRGPSCDGSRTAFIKTGNANVEVTLALGDPSLSRGLDRCTYTLLICDIRTLPYLCPFITIFDLTILSSFFTLTLL